MDLFMQPVLVIDRPGGFRKALVNTVYEADVFDERGSLLARVRERKRSALRSLVRLTDFTGDTAFDLAVTLPDGREVLSIARGFKPLLAAKVTVTAPGREVVGTIVAKLMAPIRFADPAGAPLGTFSDAAAFQSGELSDRDGRPVRRSRLWPRPEVGGPARVLAVAVGLAHPVVTNQGTA